MKWNAPKIIEVCCGMEISRYMPCLLYTSDAADSTLCRSRWSPYH